MLYLACAAYRKHQLSEKSLRFVGDEMVEVKMGSAAGEFILRTLAALRAAIALFVLDRGFAALARVVVVFLELPFAIAVGLVRASLCGGSSTHKFLSL